MAQQDAKILPDVALENPQSLRGNAVGSPLLWVGMNQIEFPVSYASWRLAAKIHAQVNLVDGDVRGIHMSRLYRILSENFPQRDLRAENLEIVVRGFLESHLAISDRARLGIALELPQLRTSLKSELKGWRSFPWIWVVEASKHEDPKHYWYTEIIYSSTCPASAALARQLISQKMLEDFGGKDLALGDLRDWMEKGPGLAGTPHAQRSRGRVLMEVVPKDLDIESVIETLEESLATPVQTTVKREDEQEFAKRNALNLMFCEDSARRLAQALNAKPAVRDFYLQVEHFESLHPHNATSFASKFDHEQSLKSFAKVQF